MRYSHVIVPLLVAIILVGIGAVGAAAPSGQSDVIAGGSADPGDGLDPALENATGTVQVIVHLSSPGDAPGASTAYGADGASNASRSSLDAYAAATGGVEIDRRFPAVGSVLATVDTERVAPRDLLAVDAVAGVHENAAIEPPDPVPTDAATTAAESTPETANATWGLDRIGAPGVWEQYGTRGGGVRIAVLDTGVDPDHPDVELAPDGWAEFDAAGARIDSTPYDVNGHGTAVSSIATGSNASGTHVGVAPNATLLHGGVLTPEGGTVASVLAGIDWAVENDVDVVSTSLGVQGTDPAFVAPVRRALRNGTFVVAASGNAGDGTSYAPANVYDAVAVGASTRSDDVRSDSSGERIATDAAWSDPPADWPDAYVVPDVVAPGEDVQAAAPGGGYVTAEQTSMATPHASGGAALLLSEHPDLSPRTVRLLVAESAFTPAGAPSEPDTRYGNGVLNVSRAMELAANRVTLRGTVTDRDGTPLEGSRSASTAVRRPARTRTARTH